MSWVIVEEQGKEEQGKRVRVPVVRTNRGVWVGWRGGAVLIADDARVAVGAHTEDDVRAPMTGKVVRVEVSVGDSVVEDQLLVVMEAMKMEYRLTAPHAGTVEKIVAAEGDLVDVGTTLVHLIE